MVAFKRGKSKSWFRYFNTENAVHAEVYDFPGRYENTAEADMRTCYILSIIRYTYVVYSIQLVRRTCCQHDR